MAPTALLKALSKNKRKRDEQEEDEAEGIAYDESDEGTSSSEEDDDEDEEEDESDSEATGAHGQVNGSSALAKLKGKGKAIDGENSFLDEDSLTASQSRRTVFKQKTLILSSRGITHRMRHMMKDISNLLPHSKTDAKLDTKHQLSLLNELADLSNCSSALFFEARRHADLYMWASMTPNGPSIRFHLLNAHTMDELKMTGNCLKGSRPILVFDSSFDQDPHMRLIKEVLMQIFAVPKTARRAKPFVDHVTSLSVADGKIWFRNYQIVPDSPLDLSDSAKLAEEVNKANRSKSKGAVDPLDKMSMNEIGPRFVLVPIKIFEGSFGGAVVWENKDFTAPTAKLAQAKMAKAVAYKDRKGQEQEISSKREFLKEQAQVDRQKSGKTAIERTNVFR